MTIFQKIISGEIPSFKIWEDEKHLAFLDIMPIQRGQTLVIPKAEVDYIFDLDDDYQALMKAGKLVAKLLKKSLNAKRIGMVVEGLEVPHVHIKLIPIDETHSLSGPPKEASVEELGLVHKIVTLGN